MKILFVNHTAARSGAENALLRLLDGLPGEHERAVACPPEGPLASVIDERGIARFDLPGTDVSLALHPLRTSLGVLALLRSALALRAISRRFGADVMHANSVRAGLIAAVARRLGAAPVVVQCHDHLPRNALGRLIREVIARSAAEVVAVTNYTAADFNHGLRRPKARCVYISVDHSRFGPQPDGRRAEARSELGVPADAPLLVHVGQITPWKGQDTAIRALEGIRRRRDAHLLIVGDVAFSSQRYDNAGFRRSLDRLADELGLRDAVHLLGQRPDVADLMGAADLLMLPSWDEPFGLVVAEAMAVGTPVVVTERGGVGEYVTDGVNGRLLAPHDVRAWTAAALELLEDDEDRARMSAENVRAASWFSDERYSTDMLAVYARAVGG